MSEVETQMTESQEATNEAPEQVEDQKMEATNGDGTDGSNGASQTDAEERKLFCGGLSFDTTDADLRSHFEKYGEIQDCTVKMDVMTKKSRGFGFITFSTKQALEDAINDAPHTVKGKQIDPKAAKARPGAKKVSSEELNKIMKVFCGGLPPETTEEEIRTYFGQYGNIENLELPMDKEKGQRRGFIFVTYETTAAADLAVKKPKQTINGKECDVKKATPKNDNWGGYGMRGGRGGGGGGRGGGRGGRGGYNQNAWSGYDAYGGYGGYGGGYEGYGGYGGYGGGGWGGPQGGYGGGAQWQQGGSYGKQGRGGRNAGYHPYR